jgi:hypothetical protein
MPFERPCEMALVKEACLKGDLRDAVVGVCQSPGSPGEAQLTCIGSDRYSVPEAEDPGQVHGMHADRVGYVGEPQILTVSVVQ